MKFLWCQCPKGSIKSNTRLNIFPRPLTIKTIENSPFYLTQSPIVQGGRKSRATKKKTLITKWRVGQNTSSVLKQQLFFHVSAPTTTIYTYKLHLMQPLQGVQGPCQWLAYWVLVLFPIQRVIAISSFHKRSKKHSPIQFNQTSFLRSQINFRH